MNVNINPGIQFNTIHTKSNGCLFASELYSVSYLPNKIYTSFALRHAFFQLQKQQPDAVTGNWSDVLIFVYEFWLKLNFQRRHCSAKYVKFSLIRFFFSTVGFQDIFQIFTKIYVLFFAINFYSDSNRFQLVKGSEINFFEWNKLATTAVPFDVAPFWEIETRTAH